MSVKVRRGQCWRNRHTGRTARVLSVRLERRHRPTGMRQAPDGRLIFLGDEEYTAPVVHCDGGAPPGFDDATRGGYELDTWLEHWEPEGVPR